MKKSKIIPIIVAIIGSLIIGMAVAIAIVSNKKEGFKETEQKEDLGISIHSLECSDYKFIEKDGKTYFKITVRNQKSYVTEIQDVRITFINDDNEVIAGLNAKLPILQPQTDTELEFEYSGEKISGNYTINISDISESAEVG